MLKRKLAVVTAIALLCATAAPAATYAHGLQKKESTVSQIGQLIKQKQEDKKDGKGNDGKETGKDNGNGNNGKGNGNGNGNNGNGNGNGNNGNGNGNNGNGNGNNGNGNGNNGNGNGNGNGNNGNGNGNNGNGNGINGNGNGNGNNGNGNGNGNVKPDPNAVNAIVKDTLKQLAALQGQCQSDLISIALQFAKATTTHQKTVLYAQGKDTFAGCVSSFTLIIANATLQLKAIGSDASPLDPLNAAFIMFQTEGRAILNRILG